MKKIIISVLLLCVYINNIKAQDGIATKGNNIVNVYYGVSLFNGFYSAYSTLTDFKVNTIGPMGAVYEHLVVDKIGVGAEVGYQNTTWSYSKTHTDYNASSQLVTYDDIYTWKYSVLRIQARANFHFVNNEKFDAYFLVSAGYRGANFSYSYTTNDPNNNNTASVTTPKLLAPIGIKPGIGIRYFFTKNIGAQIEVASGTPVIGGGLSFKF